MSRALPDSRPSWRIDDESLIGISGILWRVRSRRESLDWVDNDNCQELYSKFLFFVRLPITLIINRLSKLSSRRLKIIKILKTQSNRDRNRTTTFLFVNSKRERKAERSKREEK